jgi:hypothetical protein
MFRTTVYVPALAATLIALGALQGCGKAAESRHAGTYELDKAVIMESIEAEIAAIEDPEEREAMEMGLAMVGSGMLDMMRLTITLNADGTASSTTSMMDESETVSGTWVARGDAVTISMIEADGSAEPVNGMITGDTLELFPPEDEELPFRMVLRRLDN